MANFKPKTTVDCLGDYVYRLAISPCGNRVATVDGPINFYDVTANKHLDQLPAPDDQANCLMYSPDGKLIVAAGGGDEFDAMNRIRVYDAETLEKVADWEATASKGANVRMCRFSLDGAMLVSCGVDGLVRLWETGNWTEVARLVGHEMNVQDCCLSRDDTLVVSGGLDSKPRVWDVAKKEPVTVYDKSEGRNYSVALKPDNSVAVSSAKHSVHAWHPLSGETIAEIETGDATNFLAFTPSGEFLLAVLWGGPFLVIDAMNWEVIRRVEASNDRTHGHALSSDGRTLVTASTGNKVKFWDVEDVSTGDG